MNNYLKKYNKTYYRIHKKKSITKTCMLKNETEIYYIYLLLLLLWIYY